MEIIVEYTSFIQDELKNIRGNRFNADKVIQLAKDIANRAKKIHGPGKNQIIQKIIMGATGMKNVTSSYKKNGSFLDPEYNRMVQSFLKMMVDAEKEYQGK